jgi:hypothetical protein
LPKLPKLKIGKLHKCPKCQELYTPKYNSREKSKRDDDMQWREQFMSGLCSTDCWDNCSHKQIEMFKYVKPLEKSAKVVYAFDNNMNIVKIA